jgi:dTDP-4-amino-4,6-dideoxygalactose transaminase
MKKEREMDNIYVTQPALPPLEEFTELLEEIWKNKVLTNNGPFHQRFEAELAKYLGVNHISVFTNGTIALITALQALRISGEVVTTPFSFVATTHSLRWNNITPVFVDIEQDRLNMDPEKLEAAITPATSAVMPVHVYGNPCDVDRIADICSVRGLKLIYDAAHAFGVEVNERSLLTHGDLSVLSFHATKVFNTIEGGAIICHDERMKRRIDLLKNFGFAGETTVIESGINGKMNEVQAAFGLIQLKYIDGNIDRRKKVANKYRKGLSGVDGVRFLEDIPGVKHTYSYFPVLIDEDVFGKSRDCVYDELKKKNIFARKYFFPLISDFPMYRGLESARPENLPVATKIAKQVICLPIYPMLSDGDIDRVVDIVRSMKGK